MLDRLPVDLFRIIVHDYLQLRADQLSAVDVAFCSRGRRPDWLNHLSQLRDLTQRVPSGSQIGKVLGWMVSRKLHVSRLECGTKELFSDRPLPTASAADCASAAPPSIHSIEHLHISHNVFMTLALLESGLSLLDCLPGVRSLSVDWEGIEDWQLAEILNRLKGPLEGLDLTACCSIAFHELVPLTTIAWDLLRVLKCDVYELEDMTAISENCRHLTTLHLQFQYPPTAASLERLCEVNSSSLLHLLLTGDVPLEAQIRICTMCVNLVSYTCACHMTLCIIVDVSPIIQSLWDCCPSIRVVELEDITATVVRDSVGRKVLELDIEPTDTEYLDLVLVGIPVRVRRCRLRLLDEAVAASALDSLAGCVASLESLTLQLFTDIPPNCVSNLLKYCSILTELDISQRVGCEDIVPMLVRAIPFLCPTLRILRMDCEQPYEADFSALLDCFRAAQNNVIKELWLGKNTAVSGADLRGIAEVFPHLFTFTAMNNSVIYGIVFHLIISGKLTAKRIKLDRDSIEWMSEMLDSEDFHHNVIRDEIWLPL